MWRLHPNKITVDNWQDNLSCWHAHSTMVYVGSLLSTMVQVLLVVALSMVNFPTDCWSCVVTQSLCLLQTYFKFFLLIVSIAFVNILPLNGAVSMS